MSLNGEINKIVGDVRRAVEALSRQGITESDGSLLGTKKIYGYVCNINEDGDYVGTVDVQEFNQIDEYTKAGTGYHKGVYLSAIQTNEDGVLIVPMLFSNVVIVKNPSDGKEYVLMYSHASRIQMKAHDEVKIGAVETEEIVETDEGLDKDFDELEPTGNSATTTYTPTDITHQVTSADDEQGFTEKTDATQKVITIGETSITIDGENVNISTSGKVSFTIGGTTIEHQDGTVNIKTDNAKIESSSVEIKGSNVKIDGGTTEVTGGTLKVKGASSVDMQGPFNAIKACPFSGAPHCGSTVSGT